MIEETGVSGEFELKKKHPGCTGMFWRKDPANPFKILSHPNWPRDHASLRGSIVTCSNKKWLKATHVKQPGGDWTEAPEGAYMPCEHDNHYYLDPVKS